jgi:hypothetical protein
MYVFRPKTKSGSKIYLMAKMPMQVELSAGGNPHLTVINSAHHANVLMLIRAML